MWLCVLGAVRDVRASMSQGLKHGSKLWAFAWWYMMGLQCWFTDAIEPGTAIVDTVNLWLLDACSPDLLLLSCRANK